LRLHISFISSMRAKQPANARPADASIAPPPRAR
jgi:hypothetical protein